MMFPTGTRYRIGDELERQIALENAVDYESCLDDLESVRKEVETQIIRTQNEAREMNMTRKENLVRCKCGNDDPTNFVIKEREGDVVCKVCGTVVAANALYEGEWTRNFEGEEDQSQNGAAYNPLMSGAYNLKTGLVAASSKRLKSFQRRQNGIEMSLSKTKRDDKDTRTEYKDKKKQDAAFDMQRIASALNLTDAVVDLGHRYFCFYRDSLEKVNDMPKREVQCLILALRKKREELASVQKQHVKEKSFICPKCNLDFVTERDLRFHQCDADLKNQEEEVRRQAARKKAHHQVANAIFKKPVLKDEVQILRDIMKK
ncbi:hypothetical protein JH06_1940 [Blastocystis sp. subtype 4]|uniref:hypothetical protein n=1 Tax=Blastocystis sp. subtype 4 TaxID=944170 RepID=UPI00071131A3|nr:hypothetical protein JH06_1940 [Blastocystis sp. subtype 4]KNB44195.1 hypothetical protein JH06_1940 [Blastocystis sp. subtype 4]|eukprot:XP_014527638.1 hypothetical protein JH06_1940 [Blastocystis sp. subtype 4]